jgi:hypothetical protein
MGLYKRVRTAWLLKSLPADEHERSTYNELIAREERGRIFRFEDAQREQSRYLEHDAIEPSYFRTVYVGAHPSMEGKYLVSDVATGGVQLVSVAKAAGGHWVVKAIDAYTAVPLDSFNMGSYRWFRFTNPLPEDLETVRRLPVAKSEPGRTG